MFLLTTTSLSAQEVFISEIYFHPNHATDEDAIEVAALVGTSLSGWQILLYDGETGTPYDSYTFGSTDIIIPTDTIEGQIFGTQIKYFGIDGIQNGSPDGVALVSPQNEVVEFFSYGGTFTPSSGAAANRNATNIGNADIFNTLSGHSFARNTVCLPPLTIDGPTCINEEELFEVIEENLNKLTNPFFEVTLPDTPGLCWDCDDGVSYTDNKVSIGTTNNHQSQSRLQVDMREDDIVGLRVRNYSSSKTNDYGLMILANGGKAAFLDGDILVSGALNTDRLNVNQIIYAKEMIVKVPPFPDYVFSPDYYRMPLNDLENYLQEHQHLPNIPSAAEVSKNGLAMGDFQIKQMEKIEEIYLHLIDLNHKIMDLERENAALEAALEKK